MVFDRLISTEELSQNLENPDWILVDCRFDLADPKWGQSIYETGHIPRAVYADLNQDLSAPISATSGRHPLPEPLSFKQTASHLGIDDSKQVVVYDATGGSYAVRLWWLLKFFGHQAVAILDGGWNKWLKEQRPIASGMESKPEAKFSGEPRLDMIVSAEEVNHLRTDPAYRMIDARSPERYRGEIEPIDSIAGHIPGAVNRFHGENLTGDGTFKKSNELRSEFSGLLSGIDPANVIVYCGSGVTSIHHILAMDLAGLPGAKLYVGSWSEWIRDPTRPRATGTE